PGDLDRGLVGRCRAPALAGGHGDRPPGRHLDAQPGGHLDRVVDLAPVAADERAAAADHEAVALDLHAVAGGPQPLADAGPDGHLVGALDPHDLDRPGAVVDVEHGDAVGDDGPHLGPLLVGQQADDVDRAEAQRGHGDDAAEHQPGGAEPGPAQQAGAPALEPLAPGDEPVAGTTEHGDLSSPTTAARRAPGGG